MNGSAEKRLSSGVAGLAFMMAAVAAITIVTVWAFQKAGYTPCELCLLERNPFYLAVPTGVVTGLLARSRHWGAALAGLGLLAVIFAVSTGLAVYHAGVEWHLWVGPSGCTGSLQAPAAVSDFLKQLDSVKVVRCDAPALLVFGFSLAAWNVLVSFILFVMACFGLRAAAKARRTGQTVSSSD